MRKLLLLAFTAIIVFSLSAFGQEVKYLRANIPFDFMVGAKSLPAGTYEVKVTDNTRAVEFRNMKTNEVAVIEVMTRLAAEPNNTGNTLTFDEVGGKRALEAFWPSMDDGFLLHTTPGAHKHHIISIG